MILICGVLTGAADHGRTIFQNTKEILIAGGLILYAAHYQRTHRSTSAYSGGVIKEVCIDADNGLEVRHIIVGVFRVGVLFLERGHLIRNAGHGPAGSGICIMVVCVNADIASCNISRCNVIDYLLVILRESVFYRLRDARRKRSRALGEHGVKILLRLGSRCRSGSRCRFCFFYKLITGSLIAPIGKNIAACLAENINICQ